MQIRKTYLSSLVLILSGVTMCGAWVVACMEIYGRYKNGIDSLAVLFGITAGIVVVFSIISILLAGLYRTDKIKKHNGIFICLEILLVLAITAAGFYLRYNLVNNAVKYGIFVDYNDFKGIGKKLNEQTALNGDLVKNLLLSSENYAYGKISSLLFSLFGYKDGILLYANLLFQMLFYFMIYRIARRAGGRISGVVSYAALSFLPSQMSFQYMIEYNSFYLFILAAGILLFLYTMSLEKESVPKGVVFFLYTVIGVVFAYGLFIDSLTVFLVTGIILYLLFLRDGGNFWNGLLRSVFFFAVFAGIFVLLLYGKMEDMKINTADAVQCYENELWIDNAYADAELLQIPEITMEHFQKIWKDDSYMDWSFLYFLPVENQMVYTGMLLFALLGIIYLLKSKNSLLFPIALFYFGSVVVGVLKWDSSYEHINMLPFIAVFAGIAFQYLFRAYLVKQEAEVIEAPVKNAVDISESYATENSLMDGSLLPDKKEDNVRPVVHYIENPLPVPKKHVAKSLDYDIEISEDDDFDIEP